MQGRIGHGETRPACPPILAIPRDCVGGGAPGGKENTTVWSRMGCPSVDMGTWTESRNAPSLVQPRHNDFRWVGCPRLHGGVAYRNQNRILSPTGMQHTRRSALSQSRTLDVGMEVQKASIAVASVAHACGAAVVSLGAVGTRQCDIDTRIRPLQSKRKLRVFVDAPAPAALGSLAL